MEFILVGQPNSGKSTIFNGVVGYKSEVANFPGVTVSYTRGNIYIDNQKIEVVDIPGTYSLQTTDEAEQVAVNYILKAPAESVIINIIDTSVLSRSLELTLQLMELKKPMVIALNMIDEADRKGIKVDIKKLSALTGLPVLKTIGTKGEGISELFKAAVFAAREQILPKTMEAPHDVERVIQNLLDILKNVRLPEQWNQRFLVLKLIEKDILVEKCLEKIIPVSKKKEIEKKIYILEKQHKGTSDLVISSVRHDTAFKIFEEVAQVGIPSRRDFREKIDDVLMHPILGYLGMIAILYVTFSLIFSIGDALEPFVLGGFEKLTRIALNWFGHDSIFYAISNGAVQGFVGGIGIVLPYLFPFFIVFSILEGTGYLARIAYLIDSVMHRIGLHGLSVVPMILGYGCTVPGIMATRILKSKRDKFITAVLTTMVPCSARMIIILGVAGSISLSAAVLIYAINIVVLGVTGKIISTVMPEISPGLLLEIPRYHIPSLKNVLQKTWFRMKEFIIIAWPLLIFGSIIFEIIKYFNWFESINSFLSPFTVGILGLPAFVGIIFLFGILRKELVLVMLITTLGTNNILSQMTVTQIFTFTVFSTFYIPCLATFAALARELKLKNAFLISALTLFIAILLSVVIRLVFSLSL